MGNFRFEQRRVLVTGASQGIGAATVKQLAGAGADVMALARSEQRLAELQTQTGCVPVCADLNDMASTLRTLEAHRPLDALVNCAGVVHVQSFLDTDLENTRESFRINTFAPLLLGQAVASDLIHAGRSGAIVNVSSIASTVGTPGHAAYCASKAALDALTRVMAIELGEHGIRVNSVNPVVTRTPMAEKAWADPAKAEAMRSRIPVGRFAESDDIAAAILFLLSDEAAMINGVCLDVDGGFRAG